MTLDSTHDQNVDSSERGEPTEAPVRILNDTQTTELEARLKTIPEIRQLNFKRAVLGEVSPRQAIRAFCQMCVGYQNVSEEIGNCKAEVTCPLWAYRPHQGSYKCLQQ